MNNDPIYHPQHQNYMNNDPIYHLQHQKYMNNDPITIIRPLYARFQCGLIREMLTILTRKPHFEYGISNSVTGESLSTSPNATPGVYKAQTR